MYGHFTHSYERKSRSQPAGHQEEVPGPPYTGPKAPCFCYPLGVTVSIENKIMTVSQGFRGGLREGTVQDGPQHLHFCQGIVTGGMTPKVSDRERKSFGSKSKSPQSLPPLVPSITSEILISFFTVCCPHPPTPSPNGSWFHAGRTATEQAVPGTKSSSMIMDEFNSTSEPCLRALLCARCPAPVGEGMGVGGEGGGG